MSFNPQIDLECFPNASSTTLPADESSRHKETIITSNVFIGISTEYTFYIELISVDEHTTGFMSLICKVIQMECA